MKKIVIILFILCFNTVIWSQTLDLNGTYKGQTVKAKGRYRPNGTAEITYFYYQAYDKLEREVKTLKSQKKTLEDEKEALERKVKGGNPSTKDNGGVTQKDVARLNKRIDSITGILNTRVAELERTKTELTSLQSQIQDSAAAHSKALGRYKIELENKVNEMAKKDERIAELELIVTGKGLNKSTIGLEMSYGSSSIKNDLTKMDYWKKTFSPAIQFMVAYTHYFSEYSPLAIRVGIGYGSYNGNISSDLIMDTIKGLIDDDGDNYDARYRYSGIEESLTLKYLEIPILLHLGNSYNTSGVQAWIDAGLKAAINIGSSFQGKGLYTSEGYYPEWNLTMRDISMLGFVTDADLYSNVTEVEPNSFILWGTVAIGMNIPLGKRLAMLVGAQCGYTLTPVATNQPMSSRYLQGNANILSGESTRIFNLGAKIGLTINL